MVATRSEPAISCVGIAISPSYPSATSHATIACCTLAHAASTPPHLSSHPAITCRRSSERARWSDLGSISQSAS